MGLVVANLLVALGDEFRTVLGDREGIQRLVKEYNAQVERKNETLNDDVKVCICRLPR